MNKIKAFSKAKNMVMITDGKSDTWYWLSPKVQAFIGNLNVGQQVEFTTEEKAGKNIVNFIKSVGTTISDKKTETPKKEETKTELICEDCGATLKDNKYKVCYNCNIERKNKATKVDKAETIKVEKEVIEEYKCTECGTLLKNNDFPTCYTCSMKLKAAANKSPEQQESIKRQAIVKAVSTALISLQGEINLSNIEEVSTKLYKHFQMLVG